MATLLSFSRGGYLALAAVTLGLALTHRRRWWLLSGAVLAAVVLIEKLFPLGLWMARISGLVLAAYGIGLLVMS